MTRAGVDISIYKPHSVRTAAVSKAKSNMVPIDEILKTAGWSSERTFAKFYDKNITKGTDINFSSAVLSWHL